MSLLASSAKAASFLTAGAQQIRMIPFDEEFEFGRGRFMFNLNMLELPMDAWHRDGTCSRACANASRSHGSNWGSYLQPKDLPQKSPTRWTASRQSTPTKTLTGLK